jgi:hypothetical protein
MDNNLDIDKILNDYKESLPPIHHTVEEENNLLNSIVSKANPHGSTKQKPQSKFKFSGIVDSIKNVIPKPTYGYSIGFAMLCMVSVGVCIYYYTFSRKNNQSLSQTLDRTPIQNNDQSESSKITATHRIDTTLFASIDCDSYSRGSENALDKNAIFGIIGKQLKKNNIQYQSNSTLITQKMSTDSGSIILMFSYSQSQKSVTVSAINQTPDDEKYISVNISRLVKEIKTILQHKVRMLYE